MMANSNRQDKETMKEAIIKQRKDDSSNEECKLSGMGLGFGILRALHRPRLTSSKA